MPLETLKAIKCVFPLTSNLNIQHLSEIPYTFLKSLRFPSQIRVGVTGKVTDFTNRESSLCTSKPPKLMVAMEDCFPCKASVRKSRVALPLPVLCEHLDRADKKEERVSKSGQWLQYPSRCFGPQVGAGTWFHVHCANLAAQILLAAFSARIQEFHPLAPVAPKPPGKKRIQSHRAHLKIT